MKVMVNEGMTLDGWVDGWIEADLTFGESQSIGQRSSLGDWPEIVFGPVSGNAEVGRFSPVDCSAPV